MTTRIEWVINPDGTQGETWNPTTGCSKVSAGCKNCYAERIANRFWGDRKFTDVAVYPEKLDIPHRWKKPRRVFVDSMSDLFHPDVPDDFIAAVWMRMISNPRHTFMILTKRPERMNLLVPRLFFDYMRDKPYTSSNIWLGVSAENQKAADERIPLLLKTPAAKRFVSIEPMLERINLFGFASPLWGKLPPNAFLDWVIAGCESGPGARPSPPYIDVRHLKDACVDARVPFFLKQMWGKKMPELDGQVWAQFPE